MGQWDADPDPRFLVERGEGKVENGASGFDCRPGEDGVRPKCLEDHCCGVAQNEGANYLEICHLATENTYVGKDEIKRTFECCAQRLLMMVSALLMFASFI